MGWQFFFGGERESETGLSQLDGRIPHSFVEAAGWGDRIWDKKGGRKTRSQAAG